MNQDTTAQPSQLTLPSTIVTKLDLSRLVVEYEKIDNELTSAVVRNKIGATNQNSLKTSQHMMDFMNANQLKIGASQQRSELLKRLRELKESAPVIHVTFAADPDHGSLEEITRWLRTSIHPLATLSIGLQPDLIGGVYIRTPNHVHDMSMRAQLAGHRDLLVKEVEALSVSR